MLGTPGRGKFSPKVMNDDQLVSLCLSDMVSLFGSGVPFHGGIVGRFQSSVTDHWTLDVNYPEDPARDH